MFLNAFLTFLNALSSDFKRYLRITHIHNPLENPWAVLQNLLINFKMPEMEEQDLENDNGATDAADKAAADK